MPSAASSTSASTPLPAAPDTHHAPRQAVKPSICKKPEHKRGQHWLRMRGAAGVGKPAKRIIHRKERHQTRHELRIEIESF